jgi:lysophospholipase L1-like esterase
MGVKTVQIATLIAAGMLLGGVAAPPRPTAEAPAIVPASRPAHSPETGIVEAADSPSPVRANPSGAVNRGWIRRHEQFVQKAKAGGIDLYMEGDSITDFWQGRFRANWEKNLGGWKPGDFGISGDRTQNVLYRIDNGEFDGVHPKVVVLLIGTNNLASNATYGENTVDDTARGVKAVVEDIEKKAPDAKILLIGIFPRNDPPPKARPDINKRIDQVNAQIAKLDDGKRVRYLNFNDKLADKDGKLFPGVMGRDNLHPTDKGYQIWADAMRPILTEWLGAPAATQPGE